MRLTHFSENPMEFDLAREYRQGTSEQPDTLLKPRGLWLSDEAAEMPWSRYAVEEAGWGDAVKHKVDFECDTSNWLVITNEAELLEFNSLYRVTSDRGNLMNLVKDWNAVSQRYAGIVITPYIWQCRLNIMWYYGWDCASACVWDLSTITRLP